MKLKKGRSFSKKSPVSPNPGISPSEIAPLKASPWKHRISIVENQFLCHGRTLNSIPFGREFMRPPEYTSRFLVHSPLLACLQTRRQVRVFTTPTTPQSEKNRPRRLSKKKTELLKMQQDDGPTTGDVVQS